MRWMIVALFVAVPLLGAQTSAQGPAEARLDRLEESVEDVQLWNRVVMGLLGVSLAGLVTGYFTWLVPRVKNLIDDQLHVLVESRGRSLVALIDERDAALRLRRETPVLVVAERLATQGILWSSGFRKVNTRGASDPEIAADLEKADVVVFAIDDGCDEAAAQRLIHRHGIEFFLAFKAERSELRGPNATYANSPVTLFARLTELIAYRAAVERERSSPAVGQGPVPRPS